MISCMKYLIYVSLLLLAGCGGGAGSSSPKAEVINITPAPTQSPSPSPTPSPSSSCKDLQSEWSTTQTPENVLMGVYIGPPTNGPVYKLDLTIANFNPTFQEATFRYDATHVCYYLFTLDAASYTVTNFQGCDNPNLGAITQCGYCPLTATVELPRVYSYTMSCNTLTIKDTHTNNSATYH